MSGSSGAGSATVPYPVTEPEQCGIFKVCKRMTIVSSDADSIPLVPFLDYEKTV